MARKSTLSSLSRLRRNFILSVWAGLGGLVVFLCLNPAGISSFFLEVRGENIRPPVAEWGKAGKGLSWEVSFHYLTAGKNTDRDEKVFQARLPLNALANRITVITRPDIPYPSRAIIRSITIPGIPREINPQISGNRLRKILEADLSASPHLFWRWCGIIPWLENYFLIFAGAAASAVIAGILLRLLPQKHLENFNILILSIVVCLLIIEVFLRFYLPRPCVYYPWKPHLRMLFHPNSNLMPGVTDDSYFITNSRGIRGDELPGKKAYRLLAIGGSTTECKYLDQAEAWPRLLQTLLKQRDTSSRFWVGNIGQSGRTTRENLIQVKYFLPQLPEVDSVILLAGINDLGLRLMRGDDYVPDYLFTPGGEDSIIRRAFVHRVNRNPFNPYFKRSRLWLLIENLFPPKQTGGSDENSELIEDRVGGNYARRRSRRRRAPIHDRLPDLSSALDEYQRNLNEIIDLVERGGRRLIMVTQPSIWRPDLSPKDKSLPWMGGGPGGKYYYSIEALAAGMKAYNQKMIEVCRKRGIEYIDISSDFPQDHTVFYDDVHFNENGSRLMAERLAEYILNTPSKSDRKEQQ